MQIKLKDDVLTYIDLINEVEEPELCKYSYEYTSTLSLDFKKSGFKQFVFSVNNAKPIETNELIELLIDEVIDYDRLLTIDEFEKLLINKFKRGKVKLERY